MNFIGEKFKEIAAQIMEGSVQEEQISPRNVFQAANRRNQALVSKIAGELLKPESIFENVDAAMRLAELASSGKSCLLLMEHYSNFDIPNLYYLLEKAGAGNVSEKIISMAGAKLNKESLFVRAFTESYSRIVIYPSRSLDAMRGKGPKAEAEVTRARTINMAALHQMVRFKHAGNIILVFPAGTRYRPGDEDTRRGLKEMDSYIRSFDHLLFVGIAGNTLRINKEGDLMTDDFPTEDVVVLVASDIVPAHEFRMGAKASAPPDSDPKQVVADAVMKELKALHERAEKIRFGFGGDVY